METLFFWVGGATVLGIVTLVASLLVQWNTVLRLRPHQELQTSVREIEQQLDDLTDHLTRKESRERVRKMRDGREAKNAPLDEQAPLPGSPGFKDHLRRLAMMKKGNVHA